MTDLDGELRFHRLLEEALAVDGKAREALLSSLEADDPEMVAELRLCLEDEGDDLMGDFLEMPAVDPEDVSTALSMRRPRKPVPQPRRGPAPEDWQVKVEGPRRIGPYLPIEPVGSGGMGKVYAARRESDSLPQNGPTVALKVLRGSLGDEVARQDFSAGVLRLQGLSHRHLAAILEGGISEGGHPYYGMEWIDGPTVTRFCEQQGCDLAVRLDLALKVCEGLEYAHQQGAMHLGLKPSNILVASGNGSPCPKITDIGIAGALDHSLTESAVLTRGGLDMALYVSPEAIDSSRGTVDESSDIYALGVLLFELLVGVLPVETRGASLIQVVQTILQGEPTRTLERWQGLDQPTQVRLAEERSTTPQVIETFLQGEIQEILCRAMAKSKGDRLSGVGSLRRHLEAIRAEL